MPYAPKRLCAQAGCPAIATARGRCAHHAKTQDLARGTAQERGYDYAWSQYSKGFLSEHPICGERADGSLDAVHSRCAQEGRITVAQCVDHTVPMRHGGSKYDPFNLQSLCASCNARKRNLVDGAGRGRQW